MFWRANNLSSVNRTNPDKAFGSSVYPKSNGLNACCSENLVPRLDCLNSPPAHWGVNQGTRWKALIPGVSQPWRFASDERPESDELLSLFARHKFQSALQRSPSGPTLFNVVSRDTVMAFEHLSAKNLVTPSVSCLIEKSLGPSPNPAFRFCDCGSGNHPESFVRKSPPIRQSKPHHQVSLP